MAKKKAKSAGLGEPAAPTRQASGFREARVLPFLEKRSLAVALCLVALAVARIVATYAETGLTWDEPGHMACGMQYLAQHVYRYESQHPPLARVMSALGPFLDGVRPLNGPNQDLEGVAEMYQSGNPARQLTLMRLGILPFFLLAAAVVYWWALRHFGNAVAAIATGLFTLVPPVLAHAGLATTDMPLTACLTAAFFSLLLWAEKPTWKNSLLLGVATALAVVSKFTALGYLPAAAIFALTAYVVVERPGMAGLAAAAKARALPFGLAVVTGAVVIWAVYSFSFAGVPAPEFFDGVKVALSHSTKGHPAYLLGEISSTGWWYFFPVVLGVKTPIALLLLGAMGIFVAVGKRTRLAYWLPLAFCLGILLPAITSKVNIGVRHILPIYAGLSIVSAIGVVEVLRYAETRKWIGIAMVVLWLWMAASGAAQHPNYLAYFNEFAGDHPEKILVDSDLDWGQDTIRLARRLKELGANQVNFNTLNLTPDRLMVWPGLPSTTGINPIKPAEGWTAVSPTMWKVSQYGLEHRYPNLEPWFAYLQPKARAGSLFLYYVQPGSIPPNQR